MFALNPVPKPRRRPTTEIKCLECGKLFERRTDLVNRRKGNNYCSRECASAANGRKTIGKINPAARKGKYIPCKVCSEKFYVSPSRLKNNAKFCSRECFGKWIIDNPRKGFIKKIDNSGKKNGMYKHGRRIGGHISKKKIREQVIERDGNYCFVCGKPGPGLHMHRIIYGSQGGKYEIDNCVQLCAIHHEEVHMSKKKWLPILKNHITKKKAAQ